MNMENTKLIQDFAYTRNLSESTTKLYACAINNYSKFCGLSMDELINEAEQDEEQGKRWKHRRVKKRLIQYRIHLYRNYVGTSAKKYFGLIQTVYRHYEIELQQLPSISDKNTIKNVPIQFADLPDRELIEKVLGVANIKARAIIFFIISSGCARMECANITIKDYVEATSDYHDCTDIYDVLDVLKNRDDVVPTFNIWRKKTKKYYTTFCSPEAVNAINIYLTGCDKELHDDDNLFHCKPFHISLMFEYLNDKLNLGFKGSFRRFRPHMLRKFHASSLHNDGMSIELIDALQGRVRDKVHGAYFMDDPVKLKDEYVCHLDSVCVEWNCQCVTFKSDDYYELEKDNYEKSRMLDELMNRMNEMENYVFKGYSKKELDDMKKYV